MAATDQTYRNQRTLDIAFAVSCVLMLARMPDLSNVQQAAEAVATARTGLEDIKKKSQSGLIKARYENANREAKYQSIKADFDSAMSLLNEAQDQYDEAPDESKKRF